MHIRTVLCRFYPFSLKLPSALNRSAHRRPFFPKALRSEAVWTSRNRSLQYLEHQEVRYRYRNTVLAGENPESESYTPQDQLEYKELQSLVNRALGKLPERRLRIFRMHRFEGMKYAEIASSLSLSIKTVEAEMTKALQTLRKEIENYT